MLRVPIPTVLANSPLLRSELFTGVATVLVLVWVTQFLFVMYYINFHHDTVFMKLAD